MSVHHIQQYQIDEIWPQIEKYITSALDTGQGEINASQVRYAVVKGMAELFVTYHNEKITGAVVVEFQNYPNYRLANVVAVGGRGVLIGNNWKEFCLWLKKGGASYIEGHCHESVARLWKAKLGMRKVYTIMRGEL